MSEHAAKHPPLPLSPSGCVCREPEIQPPLHVTCLFVFLDLSVTRVFGPACIASLFSFPPGPRTKKESPSPPFIPKHIVTNNKELRWNLLCICARHNHILRHYLTVYNGHILNVLLFCVCVVHPVRLVLALSRGL